MPKDPAAVALGRKGGKAAAKSLSPQQRKDRALKAVERRWELYRARKALEAQQKALGL